MKKRNILKEAGILLIAAVMILSAVTVTANTKYAKNNAPLTRDVLFEDDFESYADFVLDFPPWTQFDGDGAGTYGFTSYDFLNEHYTGSYIIFNPSQCTPPVPDAPPHSGDKYAACFNAVLPDINDDWMFTPQLSSSAFDELSFWARSYIDDYNLDRFEVGVSTTDTNPSSFTIISTGPYIEAPIEWTEYTYDLSSYSGDIYIGIHCVSNDAFFLMVDDFSVTGGAGDPLVADADGPYEGEVGEDIQFTGGATGGVPPYTYEWDFGNGDTSVEQNPVYAYAERGIYDVTLTVTDSAKDQATDDTTATIIGPEFEIGTITGGKGVAVAIKNVGDGNATNVKWDITIDGGFIIIPRTDSGELGTLAPDQSANVTFGPMGIGLGIITAMPKITVTVTCDEGPSAEKSAEARIILFFVIIQ